MKNVGQKIKFAGWLIQVLGYAATIIYAGAILILTLKGGGYGLSFVYESSHNVSLSAISITLFVAKIILGFVGSYISGLLVIGFGEKIVIHNRIADAVESLAHNTGSEIIEDKTEA